MSSNKKTNRLINEKSPYLLQHAYNPVDWYPWSDEAFEKAKSEDKPIFLSIGYSTCHWCHVMERESFEDKDVAEILNKDFISIKVDREERPDVDSIYMNVCQAITGHGGWPLTILMTSDKKPFYAGTYFPKRTKYGRPGLIEILVYISSKWKENKTEIIESTEKIYNAVKDTSENFEVEEIDEKVFDKAYEYYIDSFDEVYGGFGGAPKFPTPHSLLFLLRHWKLSGEEKTIKMVEKTLEGMYRGGLFDHIGLGFTRYSTDEKWLVPHFEKMLYDNALLAIAYTELFLATKKKKYGEIAECIFAYIIRDMTSEDGGFFTAEDADSEGEEGKFYVWSPEEIMEVLGEQDGELFCRYYDIAKGGNFEGKSIPNLIKNRRSIEIQDLDFKNRLEMCRHKLFEHREKRVHPYKDDKILTSWNGLMIAALAIGGRVFNNEDYTIAAEKSMSFIMDKLTRDDGRLLARYRDGESKYLAYLDDYAFIIWALLELFETTGNEKYVVKAESLNKDMFDLFLDEEKGGFYLYGKDSEELIVRPKEIYDGAIPSGNSVATYNLIRLSQIFEDEKNSEVISKQFEIFGASINLSPISYAFMLMALQSYNRMKDKIVLVGRNSDNGYKQIRKIINQKFLPFTSKIFIDMDINTYDNIHDKLKGYKMVNDKTTVYICKDFTCMEPLNDKFKILEMIEEL
ncbi:thioredoxin domain-containing protein [Wukongibacter baidiensis]|uniref:thioredoxin domain-containing protein n=1 Tax=Wukongibacter baidiensis TaxID=1723361 RepID=UPI003D7F7039